MQFLHELLNCFGPENLLVGRYELLGGGKPRRDGSMYPHLLFGPVIYVCTWYTEQ